tara:strand:- start:10698 stop:11183 length:486 start_codon:yes stop_codon:yes gene_type:complete
MEHTLQHPLGLAHLATALLAVLIGALVIFTKKGTPRHKWIGRSYVALMFAVNLSAFLIYELFGGFGLFHWMAIFSLLSVLIGYLAAWVRSPGWQIWHAYFMSGSYVGLIAALAAETLTRYVSLPFFAGVAVVSITVTAIGIFLMNRFIPRLVINPSQADLS